MGKDAFKIVECYIYGEVFQNKLVHDNYIAHFLKEIFNTGNNKVAIYISLCHDKYLLYLVELY